jgi:flagella basal body P-ring formation protein FlgA
VIGANDVVLARRRITSTRLDYLSDATTAVGRVATRAIGPDQILGAANVMLPRLVKRGDEVTIASVGSAISVRVRGQALKDGGLGERVSVRNLNSKRVVEGVVNADGMVVVQSGAVL